MDGASVGGSAPEEQESGGGRGGVASRSATHFDFEHKIFRVEKSYFALSSDTREPIFLVTLGELNASLRIAAMKREFQIDPSSTDGQLLSIVEKSLRFVREIRHNDSIPREILDGTASWSVSERHRALARTRMAAHVLNTVQGVKAAVLDSLQLEALSCDPEFKTKARDAFGALAERIGLPAERKQEVLDRVEDLAREFAYIEALRERSLSVREIAMFVGQLAKLFKNDKALLPEIVRVQALIRRPVDGIAKKFNTIETKIAAIEAVLARFQAHIDIVRATRDDLHYQLSLWDDLIWKWGELDREKVDNAKQLIRETYRFAATHFPQTQEW
jgi:hypothetical protein